MDLLDLLAVQRSPKSLLQHHGWKASILGRSALFIVQLSHSYMILETPQPWLCGHLLAKWSLCFFNLLCSFVIFFLPRSKRLLILRLQSVCFDFGAQESEIWRLWDLGIFIHQAQDKIIPQILSCSLVDVTGFPSPDALTPNEVGRVGDAWA